jgi:transcriptional regulator with XRE-family HTH domain
VAVKFLLQLVSSPRMEPWFVRAKRRMKLKGIRQQDVMKALGVTTRGGVGHYLTGRRQVDPEQLIALADVLDCRLDWLLKGGVETSGGLEMDLAPEARELLKTYQLLPAAAKLQVDEFVKMQMTLAENHPELFGESDKKARRTKAH